MTIAVSEKRGSFSALGVATAGADDAVEDVISLPKLALIALDRVGRVVSS
jgi:hypothetical protein